MAERALAPDIPSLLEKIAELRPLLESNAAEGEQQRRVPQSSIDALAEIGAFRVTVPKKYGGFAGDSRAQVAVGREVGKADGGTAWVVALTNIANWLTSLYPERAQDEVFGADPDARVSVVLATNGTTKRVDGGYLVSGEWGYNSASWHSGWAIVGSELVDEQGAFVDAAQLLIPRSDLEFKDTWHVAGMRSSGSNTLIGRDVFVPDHRVLPGTPALLGEYPGTTDDTEAPYRAGWIPVLNVILVGPQLGLGQAVLERVIAGSEKSIAYTNFAHKSDSVAFQLDVAKAALLLDAADLFADRACQEIDVPAAGGWYPDYLTRTRNRAYVGAIVENVSRAIEMLLTANGSSAFAEVNALQRLWRDQAVAARHAFVLPALGYELYGKALLGRDDGAEVTPLV